MPIFLLRLEEKLSDMETEDQVLRHQALSNSPVRKMSEHLAIPTPLENGHHVSEENKTSESYFYILFTYCYLPLLYSPESLYFDRNHRVLRQQKSLVLSPSGNPKLKGSMYALDYLAKQKIN